MLSRGFLLSVAKVVTHPARLRLYTHQILQAKALLSADPKANHEHLPLTGHPGLLSGARKSVFGNGDISRVATLQTVAGTGANHLAALFLSKSIKPENVRVSNLA